jgi:hypothetical protein
MSNVKILVCTHKKGEYVRSDDVFTPVHGGKALSQADLGIQGDDTGDNISRKNPNYCELTVLYWAWKNLRNVDYIGLNHYRRYFLYRNFPAWRRFVTCYAEEYKRMSDTEFHLDYLLKYDIIMPLPTPRPYNILSYFSNICNADDYRSLKETARSVAPEYYDCFEYVWERENTYSPYNMFITRWEIFDDYCSWLFSLFDDFEVKIADRIKGYDAYHARLYGMLSEV